MIAFDSPITVATLSPSVGTHNDKVAQVCEQPSLATLIRTECQLTFFSTGCRVCFATTKAFEYSLSYVPFAVVAAVDVAAPAVVATWAPLKRSDRVFIRMYKRNHLKAFFTHVLHS